jgi:hypothetical protein
MPLPLGPVSANTITRSKRYNHPVKLEVTEDDLPLLIRALEHFAAYLEATKRPDDRCLAFAEELKRKHGVRGKGSVLFMR